MHPDIAEIVESDTQMSDSSRLKIVELLQQHTKAKLFSLTSYIARRKEMFEKNERGIPQDEKNILIQLGTAQLLVENLNVEGVDLEDYRSTYKAFDSAYFSAREYYIRYHARGVICTAATGNGKMFRYFNPVTLVIDEASQMTEALAVASISRCFRTVRKVILVGS